MNTVISSTITKKTEVNPLTRIQKLVCKWFKIEPVKKYNYSVTVTVDSCQIRVGSIVMDRQFNKWYVVGKENENTFKIESIEPTITDGIKGELVLMGSAYREN